MVMDQVGTLCGDRIGRGPNFANGQGREFFGDQFEHLCRIKIAGDCDGCVGGIEVARVVLGQ